MENEIAERKETQIVATIEFRPETLFFSPPNNCWMNGKLFLGGEKIGESETYNFRKEEIAALRIIVNSACQRHIKFLEENGNISEEK